MKKLLMAAFVACAAFVSAQGIKDRYSKIEYMIPMRDGIKLYTAVYVPKNISGKHPILMERTPYGAGPKGPDQYTFFRGSRKLQDAGYIFAFQDVRGLGYSEGTFVNIRPQLKPGEKGIDESTDTYDTVDYLVKNVPDNNNAVGLWGISYPGFYAAAGAIDTHPSLKAVSPQAPVTNWFLGDDCHHNGVLFQQEAFDFFSFFGRPAGVDLPPISRPNGAYKWFLDMGALANLDKKVLGGKIPYWTELVSHDTFDSYWQDRSLERHMKNVKCACLFVGGWFDKEDMWGALNNFAYTAKLNPTTPVFLAMGPWFHGMWAGPGGKSFVDLDFGMPTSTYFQDNIEFPFFDKYLRGENIPAPAKATVFQTGENVWKTFDQWPPKVKGNWSLYLDTDGKLSATKPTKQAEARYISDPSNPTPYLPNWEKSKDTPTSYMVDDQRFLNGRNDVVGFSTEPLAEDKVVVGPVDADMYMATTGTDADLVVKVIDVWPDNSEINSPRGKPMAGYQQLLRWDIFRGRFRNSFEKPEPFKPNEPTRVHFKLNEVCHTFKAGHRIMVQVQSFMFPLADRTANQFITLSKAADADYKKATITVLEGGKHASSISFGSP